MAHEFNDSLPITAEDVHELAETYYKLATVYSRISGVPLTSKTASGRSKRDPNQPKKPMTAYLLFSNDHRADFRKAFPEAPSQEIAKKLGDAWKTTSAEEREKYIAQHSALKKEYIVELAKYNSGNSSSVGISKGKSDEEDESEDDEEAPPAKAPAPVKKASKKKVSAAPAPAATADGATHEHTKKRASKTGEAGSEKKKVRKPKASANGVEETPSKKKAKKTK